jgi:hypothetical protein
MGNFLGSRVEPIRPFENTGVDYARPIKILPKAGRGQQLKADLQSSCAFQGK